MTERNIIFLDIDGVLNNTSYIDKMIAEAERTGVEAKDAVTALASIIDPALVAHLNDIVERADAEVVAATSWREILSVDELNDALSRRQFCGEIVAATPLEPKGRGHQIAAWLQGRSDVRAFVILDDHHDMRPVEDATVRTDNKVGLTADHVVRALRILLT